MIYKKDFKYRCSGGNGDYYNGTINATTKLDAIKKLEKKYHSILKISEAKELQEPQMTRMPKSMKEAIQISADKHNEGNFNREVRDLIQIGLKNRKRGEKK